MNASIVLRSFRYGLRCAEENKKYMRPQNSNWFLWRENYFQLLMHAQEYERAKQVYDEVMNSPQRKKMNPYQKDVWQINLAYLHFAMHDTNQITLFTPERFFNRLKKIKTDKEGLNFLKHVGLAMYMLVQKGPAFLDEYGDSFRKYMKRYIDRRKHHRSYYFSLLLTILYKYNFDAKKAERIGEKFYQKLKEFHRSSPQDRELTELIPYDHLWMMILRVMK